jgi:TolB-like protein/Flp pilus assembly protein TadD
MGLQKGARLGPYEIVGLLGAGGMGEVYRARDTRLGRDVAIKVLPAEFAADSERLRRFEQEAKAVAALDHPNILSLFDVGTHEGSPYIVTQLLEGENLRDHLCAGALSVREAVEIGVQIAQGLAAAHEKGIVHRDLKPGNVFLAKGGHVKVLDFGLAKLVAPSGLDEPGQASTVVEATEAGTRLGTVGYMSPEQASGKPVDRRADVFALGVVLYEMLTGERPFKGTTGTDVVAAILKDEPAALPAGVPATVAAVVTRCLAKDPDRRYQRGGEVQAALEAVSSGETLLLWPALRAWVARHRLQTALACASALLAVFVALNVGGVHTRLLGRASGQRLTSLAVLPVKNFSGDPTQEFFADGMTDALIAGLAQINALKVISRTSVMHYKGTSETLPQIAKELGVDGIVEASVVRSGGRVRLTAQLIDARQDRHLWANNYEREMTDVLALQSELVQAIAGEIRARVTPQESQRLKTARRIDPEVYDDTLKATAVLEYATREEQIRQAIELFQKAVDRDPTYAPAWAGLAEATWQLAATGFEFVAPGEVSDKAIAAADRGLELAPNLPEAHKARAVIAVDGEWDLEKAQQEYERALELRPNYAAAHNLYGQMLFCPLQRYDEARRHLDRARELDPLSPWNDVMLTAWWGYQGRHGKALEESERARQRNPTLWIIRWGMGFDRLILGQPSRAASEFETALKLLQPDRPASVLAPLGLAYGLAGRRADALKILTEMEQMSPKRYISPYYLAAVNSGLDRTDEAFRLLDQALEQRIPWLVGCVPDDPLSVALRRDPRWKSFIGRLRRQVRLPQGTPDPYS